jgi:hypothetical protein
MDARLMTPFSMGVFASRLSGKSVFVKKLLLEQQRLISPPFEKVMWIYKTWQDELFKELMEKSFSIKFLDDLPNFDKIGKQKNTLIIIDDFMSEASNSSQVQSLFTRGRHLGLSVIYLSQNLFHKGKYSRDLSLNMDYIVLFRNVRDATQIGHLARQMYPNNPKFLISAYEDATKEPYGHLLLDFKPNGEESLRVRANILNNIQIVYLPKTL